MPNLLQDQDKEIVIRVQTRRQTRVAFEFMPTTDPSTILISENLLKFPGLVYNKNRNRISFKSDPNFSYAYYKITPRMLAIGTGLAIGVIAGVLASIYLTAPIAASLGIFGATATSAFALKFNIAVASTVATVSAYLINKQLPKIVISEDPMVSKFYQELVIHNQRIFDSAKQQYAFWSVDDGDPQDIYRFLKVMKKNISILPEVANKGADAIGNFGEILKTLIQLSPLLIIGFVGYKVYGAKND